MAKMIDYYCTHCGKNFQAEEREIIECPGCFWSTSVKKKEDAALETQAPASPESSRPPLSLAWLKPVAVIAIIIAVVVFLLPRLGGVLQSLKRPSKSAGETLVVESGQIAEPAKAPANAAGAPAAPAVPAGTVTPQDEQVLAARASVDPQRELSPEEKQILDANAPFRTGFVEKLPSQAWTLENFEQMVGEQERFYKIQFPHSYHKKLEELFKATYLPAMDAFLAGDLMKARDLWVASLAFPLYSQDVRKHRGVALTMLRPLINDTLSKIGALNEMIVEQNFRTREEAITAGYAQFREKLNARAWAEAIDIAGKAEKDMDELDKLAAQESAAPDYTNTAGVDQDILATLVDIRTPSRPAVADMRALRADIDAKKQLAESFLPERVQEQAAAYDKALSLIASKNWKEAREQLEQIRFPLPLAQDAQAKIQVIEKLEKSKT